MLASDSGHTDVVKLLLSSGAQVVDLQDKVRHSINLIVIVHKLMAIPEKCIPSLFE